MAEISFKNEIKDGKIKKNKFTVIMDANSEEGSRRKKGKKKLNCTVTLNLNNRQYFMTRFVQTNNLNPF